MTVAEPTDLETRVGLWVPTLLFLLGIYGEDQGAALGLLEPGNPVFDACPVDLTLAWLAVVDMIASVGDVSPDDLRELLRQVGDLMTQHPPTTEGNQP